MTKKFLVEKKNGKREWVLVRQMAHDPQYTLNSKIPGLGRVVLLACEGCGRFPEDCVCGVEVEPKGWLEVEA